MHMCVSVCGRVLMCADAQKKVSDPPKLELQTSGNSLAWLLGSGPLDEAASAQRLRICIYKRISID